MMFATELMRMAWNVVVMSGESRWCFRLERADSEMRIVV